MCSCAPSVENRRACTAHPRRLVVGHDSAGQRPHGAGGSGRRHRRFGEHAGSVVRLHRLRTDGMPRAYAAANSCRLTKLQPNKGAISVKRYPPCRETLFAMARNSQSACALTTAVPSRHRVETKPNWARRQAVRPNPVVVEGSHEWLGRLHTPRARRTELLRREHCRGSWGRRDCDRARTRRGPIVA